MILGYQLITKEDYSKNYSQYGNVSAVGWSEIGRGYDKQWLSLGEKNRYIINCIFFSILFT